jgi:hypothetical protein
MPVAAREVRPVVRAATFGVSHQFRYATIIADQYPAPKKAAVSGREIVQAK